LLASACFDAPCVGWLQLLPWLERFEKIYLWLDDDEAGREGTAKLISKLGRSRCMIVRPLPDVHREGKPPKVLGSFGVLALMILHGL
jgi:hypothetical protein